MNGADRWLSFILLLLLFEGIHRMCETPAQCPYFGQILGHDFAVGELHGLMLPCIPLYGLPTPLEYERPVINPLYVLV